MSNHDNSRRGDKKRSEHGSRWEGDDNSKCASRSRSKWKRLGARAERRTRPERAKTGARVKKLHRGGRKAPLEE